MIRKLRFSWKFYVGILLVLVSLVLGGITKIIFFLYFEDLFIKWTSVVIYIISWPMLIIGIYWVGKDYADALKKYFKLKFYREVAIKGTKKAYHKTKVVRHNAIRKTRKAIITTKTVHRNVKKKAYTTTKNVHRHVKNKVKAKRAKRKEYKQQKSTSR